MIATLLTLAVTAQTLTQTGDADRRRLLDVVAPETYSWTVSLKLKAGRSAGLLFGMSADAQNGYVARLDSRLGQLILAKIGPWPKEERLATFRWEPIDGSKATFRVEVNGGAARVYVKERGIYPLLEAMNYQPAGNRLGLYTLDGDAEFKLSDPKKVRPIPTVESFKPVYGEFKHIFDQGDNYYINDHCLIEGKDGWHLYGITEVKPANPMHEYNFAHATAPSLEGPWTKQPYALSRDVASGENHLWAPHVIKEGDTYYMFYCAGSLKSNYHFRLHLATSKDLWNWKRYEGNPLFEDFYDARDPMLLKIDGTYYLYYTANMDTGESNHLVNLRTSKDLLHWSRARVVYVDPEIGTFGGPTESPFIVHYGSHFYLFCGPGPDYRTTTVYRSPNPYGWSHADLVATIPSHAAEVAQDRQGKWWVTNCGWDLDGVYLAPLEWQKATP